MEDNVGHMEDDIGGTSFEEITPTVMNVVMVPPLLLSSVCTPSLREIVVHLVL